MGTLFFTLLMGGIIAGLIQFFVIFKKLRTSVEDLNAAVRGLDSFGKLYAFIIKHWQLFAYMIIGIGGAFLVPVMYELTNEGLLGLKEVKQYTLCLKNGGGKDCTIDYWHLFVLLGYGIILGYSTVRILGTIGDSLLDIITREKEKLEKDLAEANKKIEELQKENGGGTAARFVVNRNGSNGTEELYFNKEADDNDKRIYYSGIDLDRGDQLISIFHNLLRSTHKITLPYRPALHLYPKVDKHPDGLLRSIYSGNTFDLTTLLELDARVDRVRSEARESYLRAGNSEETTEAILNDKYPYNCEHVVPRSWFDNKDPMKGDLHHLFTCEVDCNNFRANHKYNDFPDYGLRNIIMDDCGKMEKDLFEPIRNKGIVARAVLYFLVRYPNSMLPGMGYVLGDIPMLVRWHNEEPVSLFELHRNQCIYSSQGNRNPFIDYPELVSRIDFSKAFELEPMFG